MVTENRTLRSRALFRVGSNFPAVTTMHHFISKPASQQDVVDAVGGNAALGSLQAGLGKVSERQACCRSARAILITYARCDATC